MSRNTSVWRCRGNSLYPPETHHTRGRKTAFTKAKVQLQALWKPIPFHKIKYGSDSSEDEEEYKKNVALGNRMADEAFAINPHDEVDEVEVDEAENEREDKDEGKDKHEDCWEGHPIPSPLPK